LLQFDKTQTIQSLTGLSEALQADQQQRMQTVQNQENMLQHGTLYQGTATRLAISQL